MWASLTGRSCSKIRWWPMTAVLARFRLQITCSRVAGSIAEAGPRGDERGSCKRSAIIETILCVGQRLQPGAVVVSFHSRLGESEQTRTKGPHAARGVDRTHLSTGLSRIDDVHKAPEDFEHIRRGCRCSHGLQMHGWWQPGATSLAKGIDEHGVVDSLGAGREHQHQRVVEPEFVRVPQCVGTARYADAKC